MTTQSHGSLKILTFVMMGMCVFYGVMAFRMPVQAKEFPAQLGPVLSGIGILGVIAGTVNALLTGVMLPPNVVKTRLIVSLALMELCALQGFVMRMMGALPTAVWMYFAIPLATMAIFILPRALTNPE